jgi:hypothetical protein
VVSAWPAHNGKVDAYKPLLAVSCGKKSGKTQTNPAVHHHRSAGFSYWEIGERRNWSYSKVNRSIAEGRAGLSGAR